MEHIVEPEHEHVHDPAISQGWKWTTVLGNAAIGVCELATGNVASLSVTADGLHNIGDTATYYMQAENVINTEIPDERRQRLRKIAHYVIATSSLGIGVKAGYDIATDQEHLQNAAAASASLALNGFLFARLRRGMRRRAADHSSVYESDLSKHFWAIDIPSAALAVTGAVLQKYNVHIEQAAAVLSGIVGAVAFRPTEKNLAHNCLDHGHNAHQRHEDERGRHRYMGPHRKYDKNWFERMTYKPRHAKAAN
jgi:hypothetical protein